MLGITNDDRSADVPPAPIDRRPRRAFVPRPIESLFDDLGSLLADVRVLHERPGGGWEIEPVATITFLDFYFGRGKHLVWLQASTTGFRARLGTLWRGDRRVWYLELVGETGETIPAE